MMSPSDHLVSPRWLATRVMALAMLYMLVFTIQSHAQATTPLLESRMSIRITNQRMEEVLRQIAAKGNFNFSYSPDAIDVKSRVSINATNQSVREILNVLFDGTVTFKERRKYIILVKAPPTAEKQESSFYLNGYTIDELTGERLPNVSIYEPVTLASTVSNQFGYYKITLPTQPEHLQLEIRKSAYNGRTVKINSRKNSYYSIALVPDTLQPIPTPEPKLTSRKDSIRPKIEIPVLVVSKQPEPDTLLPLQRIERKPKPLSESLRYIRDGLIYAFSSARQLIHTSNVSDTLYRPFQASILPFIGTNHQLSGNVVNDISLNLFAGYSLGVNALEIGGGLNVVRLDVYGVQAAGLANAVGRNVNGVQVAGGLNLVIDNVEGIQATGGFNVNGRDFAGGQFSGMANVVGRNVRGIQFSSGVNVAGQTLYGWQIAGILNYAHRVHNGHQIGVINVADSTNTTPVGFLSYVKYNGYRRLEFTTDEVNYCNITFKTGVKKFYTIFSLGSSGFMEGKPLGSVGYGMGSSRSLGKKWMLNADLVWSRVAIQKRFWQKPQADHLRLVVALEKKLSNRLAFSIGPTLNFFNSPYRGLFDGSGNHRSPLWIGGEPDASQSNYGWVGFQAGLRLCNR